MTLRGGDALYACFSSLRALARNPVSTVGVADLSAPVHLYAGKTIEERVTGRFYTPEILAFSLANSVLAAFGERIVETITIADPFCGDGRLIAAVLDVASTQRSLCNAAWRVMLADIDGSALTEASLVVREMADKHGLNVIIQADRGDSLARRTDTDVDLLVTNPPWELLKPDAREMKSMAPATAAKYRADLRQKSDQLDMVFPQARGEGAWGGWGTNLARCGWASCLSRLNADGVLGIVLPATIMGDQSSANMRKFAFGQSDLIDVVTFPSEARLFERVDQPVIAATFVNGKDPRRQFATHRAFDQARNVAATHALDMTPAALEIRDYSIPVGFGAGGASILALLGQHPTLREAEGDTPDALWMGRELDETRVSEKTAPGRRNPFVKGRMVGRHATVEQPALSVKPEFLAGLHSVRHERVVWRDVARSSQRRRMIGTIIPKGWVAGNSLHVACYRDGDPVRTRALHAILSSLALEFQVRSRLTTGHMSLGVVRSATAPKMDKAEILALASIAAEALRGEPGSADRLEVQVAQMYGLDRNQFASMLDHFDKLSDDDKDRLLTPRLW